MTELRKVSGPSSPLGRHIGRLIAVVVVAILVAIVKPWGVADRPAPAAAASPSPIADATPEATIRPRLYDFLSFGTNEPPPRWEMWPAGNLASFSFAMRIDLEPAPAAAPSPDPSARATPATTPIPVGSPGAGRADGSGPVPDVWPTIRIPVGSNLDLIGINSPLGFTVQIGSLRRIAADGSVTPASAILGRSPWPEHFAIIGYEPEGGPDAMQPWPAGTYRLDLSIEPGGVTRTVEIVIDGAAGPAGSPAAPSASPTAAPDSSAADPAP